MAGSDSMVGDAGGEAGNAPSGLASDIREIVSALHARSDPGSGASRDELRCHHPRMVG